MHRGRRERLDRMDTLGKFLNYHLAKNWQVDWATACYKSLITDTSLIYPRRTCIGEIRFQTRPRCQLPSRYDPRFDEHPWTVTNGSHWFIGIEECTYEANGVLV